MGAESLLGVKEKKVEGNELGEVESKRADQAVFLADLGFLAFSVFSGLEAAGTTDLDFFSFFSLVVVSFLLAGALLGVEGAGVGVAAAAAAFFPFLAGTAGAGTAISSFESSSESSESSESLASSSSVFSDSESSSLESDPATVEAVSRGLAAAASSAACGRDGAEEQIASGFQALLVREGTRRKDSRR